MSLLRALLCVMREIRLRMLVDVRGRATVLGRVRVRGKGRIVVGSGVRFEGIQAPIDLHSGPGAELRLEDGVVIESGTSIEAMCSVRIGRNARLGAFVKVLDNDFHHADRGRSGKPGSLPIVVEEDASVGPKAVLLPGAHIGRAARVGAAAVVARRVADGADVEGFPLVTRARGR